MRNLLAAAVLALALPVSAQEMGEAFSGLSARMAASRQAMAAQAQRARTLGAVYYGSAAPAAQPAPDFDLPALSGGTRGLNDFFGQVVVLVFWANWSGPSKASAPARTTVARRHPDAAFLNVGVGESASGGAAFAAAGAPAPNETVLLDADQSVFKQYGGTSLPFAVVVDKQGNIAATIPGADAGAIDAAVRSASAR